MDENIRREDNLKRIEVKIAGMNYVLKTDEDEEYIMKIANYINKKMSEVVANEPQLSTSLSAMLTAFLVADEYFKHLLECDEKLSKIGVESEKYQKEVEEYKEKLKVAEEKILLQSQEIEKLNEIIQNLNQELEKTKQELEKTKKELDDFINAFDGDR
ncbi:hypothetical protein CaldiYA01_20290 [Caldicellulosiruptor diazotrophicus]|uniref:Cell division protein ZapA n=1 Tax=Caldicellulosiruptor diazotrophicus TaxID=2806205 RepID=A0ABN6EE73_9FIRM|nr:hypothetical protein CaldiYA01_20290 [Caldicellulosiruptor diazotrophicus]